VLLQLIETKITSHKKECSNVMN